MADVLRVSRDGKRLCVVLHRPHVHNALNPELVEALRVAVEEAGQDPTVRYVVLSGEGPSFCAGADLAWMRSAADAPEEENRKDAARLFKTLEALATCPKPVVARVHGAVVGGGVGLVAACDLAVAHLDATFRLSEVRLGLVPAMILPFLLRKVHRGALPWAILSAARLSARQALELGLVQAVSEDPDAVVDAWGEDLVAGGPNALAEAKRLLHVLPTLPWEQARDYAVDAIARARASVEGQAGMRAFLEKRKPPWLEPS